MYELWRVERYQERNALCSTAGLLPLIGAPAGEVAARRWHSARDATSPPPPAAADALPPGDDKAELEATVARITKQYDLLSCKYHSEKAANPSNKMAFN